MYNINGRSHFSNNKIEMRQPAAASGQTEPQQFQESPFNDAPDKIKLHFIHARFIKMWRGSEWMFLVLLRHSLGLIRRAPPN